MFKFVSILKDMTKKEQILEASEELFAEFGYTGTTVRHLAKKAGVNIAMISYYFGSKEQLFAELVEYRASFLRLKLQDIQKEITNPIEQIEKMVDVYIDRVMSQQNFHRILHRQISLQGSELNESIITILMKNVNEVRNIIEEGIKKKAFRDVDIEFVTLTFFGAVAHFVNSSALTKKLLSIPGNKHINEYPEIQLRMKKFLIDLLKKYLISSNNNDKMLSN